MSNFDKYIVNLSTHRRSGEPRDRLLPHESMHMFEYHLLHGPQYQAVEKGIAPTIGGYSREHRIGMYVY